MTTSDMLTGKAATAAADTAADMLPATAVALGAGAAVAAGTDRPRDTPYSSMRFFIYEKATCISCVLSRIYWTFMDACFNGCRICPMSSLHIKIFKCRSAH